MEKCRESSSTVKSDFSYKKEVEEIKEKWKTYRTILPYLCSRLFTKENEFQARSYVRE